MSRAVGISLEFTSVLDKARAQYESFVKEVQSKPVAVPLTAGGTGPTRAAEAATFGQGGQIVRSVVGDAAQRVNQIALAGGHAFQPFITAGSGRFGTVPTMPVMPGLGPGGLPIGAASPNPTFFLTRQADEIAERIAARMPARRTPRQTQAALPEAVDELADAVASRVSAPTPVSARRIGRRSIAGFERSIGIGLTAGRGLIDWAQLQMDFNASVLRDEIVAGMDPTARSQAFARMIAAQNQVRRSRSAIAGGTGLGAAGALVGTAFMPGIGTGIGAAIGWGIGQAGGEFGYTALSGEADARNEALAIRRAMANQLIAQDRRARRTAVRSRSSIGLTGVSSALAALDERQAQMQDEFIERSLESPETLPSLVETQRLQSINIRRQRRHLELTRDIGIRGSLRSISASLRNNPLESMVEEIQAAGSIERRGMREGSPEYEASQLMQSARIAQVQKEFAERRMMIGIGQRYTSLSLSRLLARDPTGAEAAEIAGSTLASANELYLQGFREEAERERGIGLQRLALTRQNYLEGFRGREIDLSAMRIDNPRDVTNPAAVLDEIAQRANEIQTAKLGTDEETVVPKVLREIKDFLQTKLGDIERRFLELAE